MTHKLEVSDETYDRIKDQLLEKKSLEVNCYDDLIGKQWFFRAITYHCVGRVVARVGDFLRLEDASWVADSGRFTQAIRDGVLEEAEPVGDYFVNLKAVVDFFPWPHKLPEEQK